MGKQLFPAMYFQSIIPDILKRHRDLITIPESLRSMTPLSWLKEKKKKSTTSITKLLIFQSLQSPGNL